VIDVAQHYKLITVYLMTQSLISAHIV